MKTRWLLGGLLAVMLCGCATRYDITLSSGNQITAKTKPKLVGGFYEFTDVTGQDRRIPKLRITAIEAKSWGEKKEKTFKPGSGR